MTKIEYSQIRYSYCFATKSHCVAQTPLNLCPITNSAWIIGVPHCALPLIEF